jgi:hypothetical protein
MKTLETKDWIVEKWNPSQMTILKKSKYRKSNLLKDYRGTLSSGEKEWQPASIQISKDLMKEMEESNTAIFFDTQDLKRKWKNKDLPKVI